MYIETTKLKDTDGNIVSPAEEGSLSLLRRIFQLLKPLGIISGNGSNRLSVDINNISGGTVGTVSTVTTVTTVTREQLPTVKLIVAVPVRIPFTVAVLNPVDVMAATLGLLLLHTPDP